MAKAQMPEDYHDFLEKEINAYHGSIKEYIYYLPAIFKALSGVLDRPELQAEDRMTILCVLGYLIVPNDLLPEKIYGPAGYIDDVFVCVVALDRLVKKYGISFVEPYWERDTDPLEEFLEYALSEARKDLGDLAGKVIGFCGLE